VKGGRVDPDALADGDRKKIVQTATSEVLKVGQFPAAELEANIDPPSRWGIRPYRAMAGALRLKDRVDIEVAVDTDLDVTTKRTFNR
jgi:hypothetical protein